MMYAWSPSHTLVITIYSIEYVIQKVLACLLIRMQTCFICVSNSGTRISMTVAVSVPGLVAIIGSMPVYVAVSHVQASHVTNLSRYNNGSMP